LQGVPIGLPYGFGEPLGVNTIEALSGVSPLPSLALVVSEFSFYLIHF